jgi:hypothetical protein
MAEIYKAARAVLVWLGKEENDDTQNSVELLRRISATPKEKLNELKKLQIHHPVFLEAFGQCGGSTDRWLSLKQLLSRSWFSRVWIIQEIAFASSIIVLCGNLSFPWEDCVEACEFLSYSVVNDLQTPSEIPFTGANADILSQFQQLKSADLLNVLLYTRPFEASNPRDKIFAVLGLATLGPTKVPAAEIIRIEYGLTPTEVFLEATWAIIRHSNNLKIVAEVEDSRLRNIPDLPTWVPDFSSVNRPSIYHQSQPLNADGGLKPSLTSHSNPRWLGTTAYRLGKVVSSEGLGIKQHFIESLSNVLAFIFELSPKYITGEGKLEALWRTMIQNGWEWTSPAAAGTAHHFRDWILMHIAHAAQQCAGRATTQKDFDRVATQECIDRTVTHLETYSKTDPTDIMPHHIKDAIKAIQDTFDTNSYELIESGSKYGHEFKYYRHMRIFRTNTGLLGLGQPSLQTDNSLWIIPGISVPMTLQHVIGTEDRFRVVGPAYVHGVMNGEALKWDQLDRQSIILE